MRGIKLTAGAAFFSLIGIASAVASDDAQSCAKETDAGKRLLCYDGLFRNEVSTVLPTADMGKWEHQSDVSKITDSADHYISLKSDDTIPNKFGFGSNPASILIRCKENKTSIYFSFGDHFLADIQGYGRITFRIDDKKSETKSFDVSTNNKSLGLWDGGSAVPFVKKLAGAKQMVVRMTPFNESALTVTFDVRGFDAAIKPVREACKWK